MPICLSRFTIVTDDGTVTESVVFASNVTVYFDTAATTLVGV